MKELWRSKDGVAVMIPIGGAIAASVQLAITNGAADAEYFLNALDPFGTFDNRLGYVALPDNYFALPGYSSQPEGYSSHGHDLLWSSFFPSTVYTILR